MTDSPDGGPLNRPVIQTPVSSAMTPPDLAPNTTPRTAAAYDEPPRYLSAYSEGKEILPSEKPAE